MTALLLKASGMSDEDILESLRVYTSQELTQASVELLQRRQDVRAVFGHVHSPFIDAGGPGKREYETLVRLTNLVKVAISRKHFDEAPAAQPQTAVVSAQANPPVTDISQQRRESVQAYIDEVLKVKGKRITRTHIWKSAGYKSRAEFERWESGWYESKGKKMNKSADRAFTRILMDKPDLK